MAFAPRGSATLRELFVAVAEAGVLVDLVIPSPCEMDIQRAAARLFPGFVTTEEAAARAASYTGLVTFSDTLVRWCIDFSEATGVTYGVPRTAADKLTQRQILVAHGVSRLWSASPSSLTEAQRIVDSRGPAFLKPRDGRNGEGVLRLTPGGAADVSQAGILAESVLEQAIEPARVPGRPGWLADYVSAEVVVTDRRPLVAAIFAKTPVVTISGRNGPRLITTGDILPDGLPADLRAEVDALAVAAVGALGIERSVCHVEIMLSTPPEVIEVNCRVGGHLSRLVRRIADVDLIQIALQAAAGLPPGGGKDVTASPVSACGGFFFPFPQEDGLVASRVRPEALLAVPGVSALTEISQLGSPRDATSCIAANVILEADDLTALGSALHDYLGAFGAAFAEDGMLEASWYRELVHVSGRETP